MTIPLLVRQIEGLKLLHKTRKHKQDEDKRASTWNPRLQAASCFPVAPDSVFFEEKKGGDKETHRRKASLSLTKRATDKIFSFSTFPSGLFQARIFFCPSR